MRYSVRYKPAAAAEVANAIAWYSQPEVKQAEAFVRDLERTEAHLAAHPELYQRVEDQIRRAVLRRFPYALFYVNRTGSRRRGGVHAPASEAQDARRVARIMSRSTSSRSRRLEPDLFARSKRSKRRSNRPSDKTL